MIKKFFDKVLMWLFPPHCPYCSRVIRTHELLCDDCKAELNKIIINDKCTFCAMGKDDCSCGKKKSEYKAIIAPFYYDDMIKKAVYNLKFFNDTLACRDMGYRMALEIQKEYEDIKFDFITPVPISKKRHRERGYNQSALLAEIISEEARIPISDKLICKSIHNAPQNSLSAKERKGNVIGVYEEVDVDLIKDKTILLIDDIKTTGSTLNECARVLNANGAKAVYCCTFAVTKNKKKAVQ